MVKFEGPPVLFLASVDKRQQIRGRIRETSTIGAAKDLNKVQIKLGAISPATRLPRHGCCGDTVAADLLAMLLPRLLDATQMRC